MNDCCFETVEANLLFEHGVLGHLSMTETILSQARECGFVCQSSPEGDWQIGPPNSTDRWSLQQVKDRWILLVEDVPQVNFLSSEAIAFLARRRFTSDDEQPINCPS